MSGRFNSESGIIEIDLRAVKRNLKILLLGGVIGLLVGGAAGVAGTRLYDTHLSVSAGKESTSTSDALLGEWQMVDREKSIEFFRDGTVRISGSLAPEFCADRKQRDRELWGRYHWLGDRKVKIDVDTPRAQPRVFTISLEGKWMRVNGMGILFEDFGKTSY